MKKMVKRPTNYAELRGEDEFLTAICEGDSEKVIDLILDKTADVDVRNNLGESALLEACHKAPLYIVKLLLGYGANPNTIPFCGIETPLMFARMVEDKELEKILVEHGATTYDNIGVDLNDMQRVIEGVMQVGGAMNKVLNPIP